MSLPDPVQIMEAALKRMVPGLGAGAETVSQVLVRELQRNGWLVEWRAIGVFGAAAPPDERRLTPE